MTERNRRFLLRQRPSGRIDADTFELSEEAVPQIGDGEALVRVDWISLDPTNRMWIDATPTYLPPVGIGEVMRGLGLGEVIASNSPDYRVGQMVQGLVGWQQYAVASPTAPLMAVEVAEGVSPSAYLGALGMTGLTAWVGMRDIGKPKPGETVVVSAAAGAVGSVAGQLAKAAGARVVGIAGGPDKCKLVTERLGFDAAVDHRADDWAAQLAAATPDGIDVDFENVGGDIMDAIFARLNIGARVALCGMISGYNAADPPPGPRVRQPAHPARDGAGLHRPRPLRACAGGDHRDRRPDRRGQAHPARDGHRGLRAVADGDQHALRRHQRRQARRQGLAPEPNSRATASNARNVSNCSCGSPEFGWVDNLAATTCADRLT